MNESKHRLGRSPKKRTMDASTTSKSTTTKTAASTSTTTKTAASTSTTTKTAASTSTTTKTAALTSTTTKTAASTSTTTKTLRPDRSEKLIKRKSLSLTVVKSALKMYVRRDEFFKKEFVSLVSKRVYSVSRRTVAMSLAFMGIVKEECSMRDNLGMVDFDYVFDQTFFRQLLLGTDDAIKPDKKILRFFRLNPTAHPSSQRSVDRHIGDRNLYSSAGARYLTNLKTSLRVSVEQRIRQFVNRFQKLHQLTDNERVFLLYEICGWSKEPLLRNGQQLRFANVRQMVKDVAIEHRQILRLDTVNATLDVDVNEYVTLRLTHTAHQLGKPWLRLDSSLGPLLRYNVFLNRFYESNKMKLFNVVPVCQIKSHYITIDTYVLYGILKEMSAISCNEGSFVERKDEMWAKFFKISKLRGKDCEFGYSVDTDGISACFHFERPKADDGSGNGGGEGGEGSSNGGEVSSNGGGGGGDGCGCGGEGSSNGGGGGEGSSNGGEGSSNGGGGGGGGGGGSGSHRTKEAPKYTPRADEVVFGCDPGRINIFYMATVLPDGSIKTFVLTRRQYYHDSGIFNARDQSEKWNLGVKSALEAMSTVSSKGCDVFNHWDFFYAHLCHREVFWEEYTQPRWSRQRLSLYGGKKRVFAKFFNKVFKETAKLVPASTKPIEKRVVVAYGSAKFAPGGRGELCVPTSRAYKECASRVVTKITSEFRSSKVDYQDNSVLQHVAIKRQLGRPGGAALRGLLWNVAREEFASRDLNAALNIRRYLLNRPAIMDRRRATGALQQTICKRIRQRQ